MMVRQESRRSGSTVPFFRKVLRALRPSALRAAARSPQGRAAAVAAVLVVFAVPIVQLLLAPATLEQAGVPGHLKCPPIGQSPFSTAVGQAPPEGPPLWSLSRENSDFVYAYAREKLGVDGLALGKMYDQVDYETEVARVCAEARTNQVARLVVVVGAELALVLVIAAVMVTRRLAGSGQEKPPADEKSQPDDIGTARREQPPSRPPGLRPRAKTRPEPDGVHEA